MLNLVVIYGSYHLGESIVQYLSRLKNLVIVGQSSEVEDAIKILAERRPHVVIINVHLKNGLGFDVLHRAKLLAGPPIVIMTAASSYSQYRRECIRHGADYYFRLPDEINEMMSTISRLAFMSVRVDEETKSETESAQKSRKRAN